MLSRPAALLLLTLLSACIADPQPEPPTAAPDDGTRIDAGRGPGRDNDGDASTGEPSGGPGAGVPADASTGGALDAGASDGSSQQPAPDSTDSLGEAKDPTRESVPFDVSDILARGNFLGPVGMADAGVDADAGDADAD